MNRAVKRMMERYECRIAGDYERALREVLQEIALVGLWRGKLFEHAAFYGGTALRIFYGLERFSEDLDFTLYRPDEKFSWEPYQAAIIDEMASFGFEVEIAAKKKSVSTSIQSAFLRANTFREMLQIGIPPRQLKSVHQHSMIRIKVEVDTAPPLHYASEHKYLTDPIPIPIACVNESQLFAAKLYAAFYRTWKNRVKGRDWYDVVWFIRKKVVLDLDTFSQLHGEKILTADEVHQIAVDHVAKLDIAAAKQDIVPFLRDGAEIEMWSPEFFLHWFSQLRCARSGKS